MHVTHLCRLTLPTPHAATGEDCSLYSQMWAEYYAAAQAVKGEMSLQRLAAPREQTCICESQECQPCTFCGGSVTAFKLREAEEEGRTCGEGQGCRQQQVAQDETDPAQRQQQYEQQKQAGGTPGKTSPLDIADKWEKQMQKTEGQGQEEQAAPAAEAAPPPESEFEHPQAQAQPGDVDEQGALVPPVWADKDANWDKPGGDKEEEALKELAKQQGLPPAPKIAGGLRFEEISGGTAGAFGALG